MKKGDRVRMSARGIDFLRPSTEHEKRIGTVVGLGRRHESVRVLWDGNRTASPYHPSFLELEKDGTNDAR